MYFHSNKILFLALSFTIHLIVFDVILNTKNNGTSIPQIFTFNVITSENTVNDRFMSLTLKDNNSSNTTNNSSHTKITKKDSEAGNSEKHFEKNNWLPEKHYRTTEELDSTAIPIGDWNVDLSIVPKDISFKIVFTVWISETGKIDLIEFQSAIDEPNWMKDVKAKLGQTKMEPASFEGLPVPSTMTIEVSVDP